MDDQFLSRDQVRDIDRRAVEEFGIPGVVLMENAGRGCVELLQSLGVAGPVAICAGKGNNGGDGFVVARHLESKAVSVRVLLFADPEELRGDAAINFEILQRARTSVRIMGRSPDRVAIDPELADADWIIDGLLGIGVRGAVREPFRTAIEAINAADTKVLAIDVPSGMDCDTGVSLGTTVVANHTATFVRQKLGFQTTGSVRFTGTVHVIELGIPPAILRQ